MANYQVWYETADGQRIEPLNGWSSLEYVRVVGDVGVVVLIIPESRHTTVTTIPDRRVSVWRLPDNGSIEREVVCFLRRFTLQTSNIGLTDFTIGGHDQNDLLRRRIVAYYAESAESSKTDNADTMMAEIVDENLATDTDYDGSESGRAMTGLSVSPAAGVGPSLTKGFSWRNVLDVLQDIQAATKSQGNEVFFGIVPVSDNTFAFETKIGQWGADRTLTGQNPIVFSLENGNLVNPSLSYDHTNEKSFIYGLGQGEASARTIQEAQRSESSVYGRNEAVAHANMNSATAGVLAAARDELARRRLQVIFSGDVIPTRAIPYGGVGWRLGDRTIVSYRGLQIDVFIRSVHVTVGRDGKETVSARVESINE